MKLDLKLIHDIATHFVRETIVGGMANICRKLGTTLIAEGIETVEESAVFVGLGISLQQGYLFARPAIQSLVPPTLPADQTGERGALSTANSSRSTR